MIRTFRLNEELEEARACFLAATEPRLFARRRRDDAPLPPLSPGTEGQSEKRAKASPSRTCASSGGCPQYGKPNRLRIDYDTA